MGHPGTKHQKTGILILLVCVVILNESVSFCLCFVHEPGDNGSGACITDQQLQQFLHLSHNVQNDFYLLIVYVLKKLQVSSWAVLETLKHFCSISEKNLNALLSLDFRLPHSSFACQNSVFRRSSLWLEIAPVGRVTVDGCLESVTMS